VRLASSEPLERGLNHQATNKEELIKKTREALKRMAKSRALIRSFFKRCNVT
jgi:hypothetical protein